jgi:uncharacterized protein
LNDGGLPLPVSDRDSRPWWEAVARHQLTTQACDRCGRRRWPPRALCARCGSLSWRWEEASGRGVVASWIVNRHPFFSGMNVPSVVVLVRLAEADDILIPGGWSGPPDGSGLRVGLPVEVGYEDNAEGVTLLVWRPAG